MQTDLNKELNNLPIDEFRSRIKDLSYPGLVTLGLKDVDQKLLERIVDELASNLNSYDDMKLLVDIQTKEIKDLKGDDKILNKVIEKISEEKSQSKDENIKLHKRNIELRQENDRITSYLESFRKCINIMEGINLWRK